MKKMIEKITKFDINRNTISYFLILVFLVIAGFKLYQELIVDKDEYRTRYINYSDKDINDLKIEILNYAKQKNITIFNLKVSENEDGTIKTSFSHNVIYIKIDDFNKGIDDILKKHQKQKALK